MYFMYLFCVFMVFTYKYKNFLFCEKNEPSFFKNNINYDLIINNVWRQFWVIVRSGKYKDFNDEKLKHTIEDYLIYTKIYIVIFIIALVCLIVNWSVFK